MADLGDMKGWKLGQKKTIKAKASEFESAVKAIQAKFGAEWTVVVNWTEFATHSVKASSSYLADPGRYIVTELLGKLVSDDIGKMDQDTVDTLNKIVGGNKVLTYTCGPKDGKYTVSNRLNFSVDEANGCKLEWSGDYFGYSHNAKYLLDYIDSLPGVAAHPAFEGNWRLAELKTIVAKKSTLEQVESAIKAKLGAEWSLLVDWASMAEHSVKASSSYRKDPGRYIVDELLNKYVTDDLNKYDEDVVEAANELVGDKKVINIKLGPKTGSYKISNRLNLAMDEDNGFTAEWSGDYFGYSWNSDYSNKYILDNA